MNSSTPITTKEFTILLNSISSYKNELYELSKKCTPEGGATMLNSEYAEAHALFLKLCATDTVTLTTNESTKS